jgi:hypothetical protein
VRGVRRTGVLWVWLQVIMRMVLTNSVPVPVPQLSCGRYTEEEVEMVRRQVLRTAPDPADCLETVAVSVWAHCLVPAV